MSRLHPVFHALLLEKYIPSSNIPDRESPTIPHVELDPLDNSRDIETVLDSRKVGRRYDYFIHWRNFPISERSWILMSDIPTTLNEKLEQFHRRNPRLPRPPRFNFDLVIPPVKTLPPPTSESLPLPIIPPTRVPTPPPEPRSAPYEPPSQTTLRSGRVARPPASKDYAHSILKKGMM
ncbi:hypothetical protein C8R44DRAFT_633757 [Mycena epipterygia]|nr:hypothetical protein C8R44DRAFT_633757 [Mycena epipterygia]